MSLQLRRDTAANLAGITPAAGEQVYATDTKLVYVGDGSTAGGNQVGAIPDDAVTNAKLANVATATIKGRATAATGDPEDLTGTQARSVIDPGATTIVSVTGDRNPILTADAGKTLVCDGAHTLTLTSATGWTAGQSCFIRNRAGSAVNVTIAQGSGATVNVPAGQALTIPQFGLAEIYCGASNVYDVNGHLNAA